MKLSVIIPIYNSEKYIKRCLDSVKACPLEDMECILINDGSTDKSEEICKYFLQQDSRFCIINKENAGVSAARNSGVEVAKGEYVMFLDADDYLMEEKWSVITKYVKQGLYQLVAFSYLTLFANGKIKEERYPIEGAFTDNKAKIRDFVYASSFLNTCWGKLFRLNILNKNSIRFREELRIGEDYIFVADYYKQCNNAIMLNEPILFYRQHGNSAMKKYNMDQRMEFTKILFDYNKECVKQINDKKLYEKMYFYYFRVITNIFLESAKSRNIKELNKLYKESLSKQPVNEIVSNLHLEGVRFYKNLEGKLFKENRNCILAIYFKLKAYL